MTFLKVLVCMALSRTPHDVASKYFWTRRRRAARGHRSTAAVLCRCLHPPLLQVPTADSESLSVVASPPRPILPAILCASFACSTPHLLCSSSCWTTCSPLPTPTSFCSTPLLHPVPFLVPPPRVALDLRPPPSSASAMLSLHCSISSCRCTSHVYQRQHAPALLVSHTNGGCRHWAQGSRRPKNRLFVQCEGFFYFFKLFARAFALFFGNPVEIPRSKVSHGT
ncbi:hypothetical protein B0H14DRAFT_3853612 [Mycena olivaceomarginata]|nr:hypothetical protein B0H14DRAFT_3853612 [Mycena olivaceomarginata]